MLKQEFMDEITRIGALEDPVTIRSELATLAEQAGADYDSISTLQTQNENLTSANETLRAANMDLWLKVGKPAGDPEPKPEPKPEKRKFEDLFDEKGGIK